LGRLRTIFLYRAVKAFPKMGNRLSDIY
jgi:hypothetical protein